MTDAPTTKRPKRTIDDKLRARIERTVERLLNALDVLDAPAEDLEETDPLEGPDPDAEPDEDGEEYDAPEDGGDAEPQLGSFDRMTDQSKSWRQREGYGDGFHLDAEADESDLAALQLLGR